MRTGVIHLVFGLLLIAGGIAATMYFEGFYWFGAYIVGAIEIVRGIVIIVRTPRIE